MKLTRKHWIFIGCAVVVLVVLLVVLLRPRPQAAALPVVAVEPVQVEDVSIYGEYVGRIRAQQFVEIRARVEGYLEKMLFAEEPISRRARRFSSSTRRSIAPVRTRPRRS